MSPAVDASRVDASAVVAELLVAAAAVWVTQGGGWVPSWAQGGRGVGRG